MDATNDMPAPLWRPSPQRVARARVSDYTAWVSRRLGRDFPDYEALWRWSVEDANAFWLSIWDYFEVRSPDAPTVALGRRQMPGAQWFPGLRVNFADQVFRHASADRPAILFREETGEGGASQGEDIGWEELRRRVAVFATALTQMGVQSGDRVAAYLPNRPEAVVAFLACASVGAIWSMCSPDMGAPSVLDRFHQIRPRVLIAADGYRYGGKSFDRRDTVAELRAGLPTVEALVWVPVLGGGVEPTAHTGDGGVFDWRDLQRGEAELAPAWLPFEHPLWIVYSSGTTGVPKPIVHGHGGIILGLSVTQALHNDLGPQDRYHWYSSSGWIMWNCQVGGLLVGSTICLYDGNPGFPDLGALWRFAAEVKASFFGAGAAFYASCLKAGIRPNQQGSLAALRSVGSTGSPLSPECYEWIYASVGGGDIWLSPMSGGTDLAGPFIAGVPTLPVYLGEMQCRVLGAAVQAFDEQGRAVVEEVGELVCTQPMPNMPLFFWNDEGDARYLDSYFDMFPGIWRHGDWIRITARGGAVIYGRSDATINRHGIRMGTSELYRAVEAFPEVLDSLVVDLEYLGRPSYMPLFLVLRDGAALTPGLEADIRSRIRSALSARHVPDELLVVPEVPRTLSGKKLELPIRKLLLGHPAHKVVNPDAMANPASLAWFEEFARGLSRRMAG